MKQAASQPNPRLRMGYGPESDFYNTLKGQRVTLVYHDGEVQRGTLRWVDRYSIGILANDGIEVLVQKNSFATIRRDDGHVDSKPAA